MASLRIGCLTIAALTLAMPPAHAAEPTGMWLTAGAKAKVRIAKCGNALCGILTWIAEPNDPQTGKPKTDRFNADAAKRSRPVIGIAIVLGMKPSGQPETWSGRVYNAEDGKTYAGTLVMQTPDRLKLEGCALAVFCKSQVWKRTR
jgi:uncharacterized protein (DUF2147 family)